MLMKKILMIGAVLAIVLVLAAAGFYVYGMLLSPKGEAAASPEKIYPVYQTEVFTVNMSGYTNRLIKTQFTLELSNEKVKKELEEKKHILQDTIIMVLSRQTPEQNTAEGKESIKNDVMKAINGFLKEGQVQSIYYLQIIFN